MNSIPITVFRTLDTGEAYHELQYLDAETASQITFFDGTGNLLQWRIADAFSSEPIELRLAVPNVTRSEELREKLLAFLKQQGTFGADWDATTSLHQLIIETIRHTGYQG
ncbi:MAG: hypothetical protein OHK0029_29830 [Armatimonadaceae bacterium]